MKYAIFLRPRGIFRIRSSHLGSPSRSCQVIIARIMRPTPPTHLQSGILVFVTRLPREMGLPGVAIQAVVWGNVSYQIVMPRTSSSGLVKINSMAKTSSKIAHSFRAHKIFPIWGRLGADDQQHLK